jgi:phosphoribosyl 1,2-cyclic phosphodiesterase
MSLYIASLNSGSNGNCYYVGDGETAVLIDAGLSCRETERRMKQLGLNINQVKAIFISHEHADHVTGLPGLTKKYPLPIYITAPTLAAAKLPLSDELVQGFDAHQAVAIAGLRVTAFPKWHDAADPHSFIVSNGQVTVGIFTDIGQPCGHVTHYFAQCHAAFLEANYCEDMLAKSHYPVFLKKRISGQEGHLSNAQAVQLFVAHKGPQLSHLLLSHLSKNNNSPQLAETIFKEKAGATHIAVASRYTASAVYHIQNSPHHLPSRPKMAPRVQGSLF